MSNLPKLVLVAHGDSREFQLIRVGHLDIDILRIARQLFNLGVYHEN